MSSRSNDGKRFGVKRLLVAASYALSLAAVAALITGATYGFFKTTSSAQSNTFTAGTVTLGQPALSTCSVTGLAPGDASTGWTPAGSFAECSFTVTYGGSVPAYLALDVSIAGTTLGVDPTGALAGRYLYDSSGNGLQVLIKDDQGTPVTYMTGTTLGGGATSGSAPSATNLLVSKSAFSNGGSVTFTVDYQLPSTNTNAYQGARSSITLTAHAVQSKNNGSATTCTAGQVCAGIVGWN